MTQYQESKESLAIGEETIENEEERLNGCPDKTMREWVEEEDSDSLCRPCLIGPIVQWYVEELREQDRDDLADKLEQVVETGATEQVCQTLDDIKQEVEGELQVRLQEFDCHLQVNAQVFEE